VPRQYTDREKQLATLVMQKWLKMYMIRKRYQQRKKIHELISQFSFNYEITAGKFVRLHIIIKKYRNPTIFKYCISNMENTKKRDDMLFIKSFKLPGALTVHSSIAEF